MPRAGFTPARSSVPGSLALVPPPGAPDGVMEVRGGPGLTLLELAGGRRLPGAYAECQLRTGAFDIGRAGTALSVACEPGALRYLAARLAAIPAPGGGRCELGRRLAPELRLGAREALAAFEAACPEPGAGAAARWSACATLRSRMLDPEILPNMTCLERLHELLAACTEACGPGPEWTFQSRRTLTLLSGRLAVRARPDGLMDIWDFHGPESVRRPGALALGASEQEAQEIIAGISGRDIQGVLDEAVGLHGGPRKALAGSGARDLAPAVAGAAFEGTLAELRAVARAAGVRGGGSEARIRERIAAAARPALPAGIVTAWSAEAGDRPGGAAGPLLAGLARISGPLHHPGSQPVPSRAAAGSDELWLTRPVSPYQA